MRGRRRRPSPFGEVVMLSVSWTLIDEVLAQAGALDGKIVIDTCNQFGREGEKTFPRGGRRRRSTQRGCRARATKSFDTLTAGFQAQAAGRTGPERVAMFLCGDDPEAKRVVGQLIDDGGFTPVDVGGLDEATPMEAPRRDGAVYGEEEHEDGGARLRRGAEVGVTLTLYEWAGGAEALDRLTGVLLPSRPRRPRPVAGLRGDVARAIRITSRSGSARSSAAPGRLHRGARRLPAHAVQAPGAPR